MKWRKKSLFWIALALVFLGIVAVNNKSLSSWGKKQIAWHQLKPLLKESTPYFHPESVPKEIAQLPLSPSVIATSAISIHNLPGPAYNASIVKKGSHYLLFFRYNTPSAHSYIGYAELDGDFHQTDREFQTLNALSESAQDPRVFYRGNELWVAYNDVTERPGYASMHLARVNLESNCLEEISDMDLHLKHLEKNWSPFEHEGKLFFEYTLNPHQILAFETKEMEEKSTGRVMWPALWGPMRGGTPALPIGDHYLAFFHSHFKDSHDKCCRWYVMGAYLFEADPPYRLCAVSPYPILFKGLYDSPLSKPTLHCIFPAGMLFDEVDGKELIHVTCGENDTSIKILTFDKKALLNSLVEVR